MLVCCIFTLRLHIDLLAACLFIRMGSHFIRLLAASKSLLNRNTDMRPGPPPEEDKRFAQEVIEMVVIARAHQDA